MKTNYSIFTKALSLILCVIMCAGVLSACFQMPEFNPVYPTNKPSDVVENTPNEDPVDPENPEPVDPNVIFSASTTIDSSNLVLGTLANDLVIGGEGATALVPADVVLEAGTSSLALTLKNVEENDVDFGDAEVLNNLDVHVSGIAANNTVPMTVALGAILPSGLANTELKLYHIENGAPVLMTRVESATDFAIHNQYVYNAETGEVTIYVASFSVFAAVRTEADKWDGEAVADGFASGEGTEEDPYIIETAAQLVYFRNQVDAGVTFEGKFVKLNKDIDLDKKLFDPIGFGYYDSSKRTEVEGVVTDTNTVFLGTFDGAGHTIYNLYQNCWELDPDKTNYSTYTYSTAGAGLFASIKDATIKNIAINGAEVVFECVDMGVLVGYAQGECHFENIVITDANIANYNRYTGGLVGEVSYGADNNEDGYSHTFKNITIDSSVTVSGLWGSFGCGMGGVIGGKWGTATVLMENVVSAPVMDVYNDVTSAYQWYAFRGCGMLIGHTEEPYSDGRHSGIATASFLTCENVKVYYGDWVNYTYYEFENQDSGTGRSYPWVRAEAGNYCDAFSNIRYGVPTHDGVKVSDLTKEELEKVATDYTPIVFNQLYGADRGMYGQAKHDGVDVIYQNTKTIYIKNNLGWTNLKLHYWHKNGEDIWTNVDENGIALTEENGVYKVVLPAYAYGFKIVADNEKTTHDVLLSDVTDKAQYSVGHFVDPMTIYFQNNWLWSNVYIYYWYGDDYNAAYPGVKMTKVENDGVYDVYSFTVPMYAEGFIISDGSGDDTKKTQNLDIVTTEENTMFYMNYNNTDKHHALTLNYTTYKNNHTIVHLKPIGWWGGARYAAYVWNDNETKWIDMVDLDKDGIFTCWVPNDYKNVIFGRMNTATTNNSFDSSDIWNQTIDLTIPSNGNNLFTISNKLYLKPNSNWIKDGARFAAYFFGNGETWKSMTYNSELGLYEVDVPTDKSYPNVIFCRMNPNASANNWNNKWNQTGDLTIPTDGKNLFEIPSGSDVWDGSTTTWSIGKNTGTWSTK